jgi:MurNAc alpha-1-phosphate uridylyltransferase
MMPIAILAGGLGSRIYPLTSSIPKSLIQINGRPFIDIQLENLAAGGFQDVVICIGHLGEQIRSYVGAGERYGLSIEYSKDGEISLGTGGAIRNALEFLGKEFAIVYGDSLLDLHYKDVIEKYMQEKLPGLMTIYKQDEKHLRNNVAFVNGRIVKYSKSSNSDELNFIDYGFEILQSQVFENSIPEISFDLSKILEDLAETHQLAHFEAQNSFYEIGSLQGIDLLEKEMKKWIS